MLLCVTEAIDMTFIRFIITLILLLPRFVGLTGVQLAQPLSDALTLAVSLPFLLAFCRKLRKMEAGQEKE